MFTILTGGRTNKEKPFLADGKQVLQKEADPAATVQKEGGAMGRKGDVDLPPSSQISFVHITDAQGQLLSIPMRGLIYVEIEPGEWVIGGLSPDLLS